MLLIGGKLVSIGVAHIVDCIDCVRGGTHPGRPRLHHARTVASIGHHRTVWRLFNLAWQKGLRRCEVAWRMHLLQDGGHAMLSILFLSHLGKLAFRNGSLLVSLLQLLVRQEVLGHDARDFFKVIEDGKAGILYFLFRWAELTEVVV